MIVAEFSMTPIGKGESVSPWVARAVDIVKASGLEFRLGPMGTCVEGDWDSVFGVMKKALEAVSADCNRVSISIKVDYRKGPAGRLDAKVDSVKKKLT